MGWNTWCTNDLCGLVDHCSEHLVKSVVDAMKSSGLVDLGYEYINLDDCWADHSRTDEGRLQPSPLFPSGMAHLADYIDSAGMKLGLYTCVGTKTCKYNRPGSYGHFDVDAQTFAEWGPWNCTALELYTEFSAQLNATNHPMLFSLCEWGVDDVWEWGGDVGQMFRIQMDHLPLWQFPPKAQGVGYGQGVSNIIEWMGDLQPSKYTRQFAYLDPDFLMTLMLEDSSWHNKTVMDYVDSKTEFSFWALWSSPLIFATDPRDMSDAKKSILMNAEIIAVNQDRLFTAGDRILKDNDDSCFQVWTKPLQNGDVAVIFYYPGEADEGCNLQIRWDEILSSSPVHVRDLWAHEDLIEQDSASHSVHLQAHEVEMLRLTF
ncbi:hypothetical protein TrVE_jg2386 [Triparma verrucosa]|uniref:Alpha-galactosidase n=1 Tax=Triparma verrucosa TaxID=1606542 RepID=A0A9W7BHZ1_9STRA|nr:hypothetical protein TrVE_jg2386 [Triparma verrucosa]